VKNSCGAKESTRLGVSEGWHPPSGAGLRVSPFYPAAKTRATSSRARQLSTGRNYGISLGPLALGRAPRVSRTEQPAPVVIPASELLRWVVSETSRGRCGDWLSRVADPVVPLPSIQTRDPRTCSAARKPCSNLTQYSRRGVEILPYLTELSYKGRHVTRGPLRHRWDPRGKSTDGALKCVAHEEMP
jgi:hypothetical protein